MPYSFCPTLNGHHVRHTKITLGNAPLDVWVALTANELEQGVRSLPPLEPGQGLLMYISPAREISLSMAGVTQALEVAFLSPSLRITAIRSLTPTGPEVESPTAVGYALELPVGWLEHHHIQVGTRAQIPEETEWRAPEPPRIGF